MGGWSQDGGVGWRGVCISPQLGHLPDAGGGPWRPRGWEEAPSKLVGRGGTEGGEEVETRQDQCPWGIAERGEGFPCLEGHSGAWIRGNMPSISPIQSAGEVCPALGPGPTPLEAQRRVFAIPTQAREACWAPRWRPPPPETRGRGTPGPLLFSWA